MWTVSEYEGEVCEGGVTVRVDCDNCGKECYVHSWDIQKTFHWSACLGEGIDVCASCFTGL